MSGQRPWKFRRLLLALLALLAIQPAAEGHDLARVAYTTLWSLVLIATIIAIYEIRWQRYVGLCLALPVVVGLWGRYLLSAPAGKTVELAIFGLATVFFAVVAVMVMRRLVTREVTTDNVAGAVCAYLFLGLGTGLLFTIIETQHPHSFESSGRLAADLADPSRRAATLTYFSFVTLATVGYGDIEPATPLTRILAVLEAVLGQFYLAVFVAGLVGIRVSRHREGGPNNG